MLGHLKFKKYAHHFQAKFYHLRYVMKILLQRYAPVAFLQRRNVKHTQVDDATLLALLLIQTDWGITSQAHFCRIIKQLLPRYALERSRFNRRSRQLLPVLQCIRRCLTERCAYSDVAVIDSFPVPLCQNIRNQRVRIFQPFADIGYNATKRMWFYGFKVHVVMEADGLILNYVVTKASVHDYREALELIHGCPCPDVIADVGYVGRKLVQAFKKAGYLLWTPFRSNMRGAKAHNSRQLKKLRRRIESCFSSLNEHHVEQNVTRTCSGFQTLLELIILLYNLHKAKFITN